MGNIIICVDFMDKDYEVARKGLSKRVCFGDFFEEGERRGAEYLLAKTTDEEAQRVIGSHYKRYVQSYVSRYDRETLENHFPD